jgi:GR25 family glycosyltransferase involved in LPS biosynthesis
VEPTATYRISFAQPIDHTESAPAQQRAANETIIPAVIAAKDPRWLKSNAARDSLTIGMGAAGCLLAHIDAWRAIAEARDPYGIVLESDAVRSSYGGKWAHRITQWADKHGANLIQLGSNRDRAAIGHLSRVGEARYRIESVIEQRFLLHTAPVLQQAFTAGAHAYLVSRTYAMWLAEWNPDFRIPVDQWLHVLARDARHRIFRTRQDLWVPSGRDSEIESFGR